MPKICIAASWGSPATGRPAFFSTAANAFLRASFPSLGAPSMPTTAIVGGGFCLAKVKPVCKVSAIRGTASADTAFIEARFPDCQSLTGTLLRVAKLKTTSPTLFVIVQSTITTSLLPFASSAVACPSRRNALFTVLAVVAGTFTRRKSAAMTSDSGPATPRGAPVIGATMTPMLYCMAKSGLSAPLPVSGLNGLGN